MDFSELQMGSFTFMSLFIIIGVGFLVVYLLYQSIHKSIL